MRQGLIVTPQPSPIAQAFGEAIKGMYAGGTAQEQELKEAMAQHYTAKNMEMQNQQRALREAPQTLAGMFEQHMPQGMPVDEFIGPPPETGFQTETPEQRAQRIGIGLADVYGRVGKENAEAMHNGLAAGQTFGTADDMRRSMVLQGKAIDQDFAPTGAEGNRIALRNQQVKPLSESEVKGRRIDQNFDNLDSLSPSQLKVLGALPSDGITVTSPDGTVMQMGGSGKGGKTTEAQDKAGYVAAMSEEAATGILNAYDTGKLPNQTDYQLFNLGNNLPAAAQPALVPGMSPEGQNFYQMMRTALPPQLMIQSGMGVNEKEVERKYKELIPVPGEDPSVTQLKRNQFATYLTAVRGIAGPAYKKATTPLPGKTPPAAPGLGAAAPAAGGDPIAKARDAIGRGADRNAVIQRLQAAGITPPPDL